MFVCMKNFLIIVDVIFMYYYINIVKCWFVFGDLFKNIFDRIFWYKLYIIYIVSVCLYKLVICKKKII